MMAERPNLLNGGIQYYNNYLSSERAEDGEKALKLFSTYVDMALSPMFEKENLLQADTLLPQVAYYAGMVAVRLEDYHSVLKYAPYAKDDKAVGQFAMELTSTALKAQGDTVKWIASLKRRFGKIFGRCIFLW